MQTKNLKMTTNSLLVSCAALLSLLCDLTNAELIAPVISVAKKQGVTELSDFACECLKEAAKNAISSVCSPGSMDEFEIFMIDETEEEDEEYPVFGTEDVSTDVDEDEEEEAADVSTDVATDVEEDEEEGTATGEGTATEEGTRRRLRSRKLLRSGKGPRSGKGSRQLQPSGNYCKKKYKNYPWYANLCAGGNNRRLESEEEGYNAVFIETGYTYPVEAYEFKMAEVCTESLHQCKESVSTDLGLEFHEYCLVSVGKPEEFE